MVVIDNGHGNKITIPCDNAYASRILFDMYENFNKEYFDDDLCCPTCLKPLADCVYNAHNQTYNNFYNKDCNVHYVNEPNFKKVCLGFSSGLDSMYQALVLKDKGYDVTLFHVKGINTYENGQGTKYSKLFAEKYGFEYVEANIQKTNNKTHKYKQYWPENPIKNQLILAMMMDWCVENNCILLSLGDDFGLGLSDAVVGVNLTDAKEITQHFLKGIDEIVYGFGFIKINEEYNKAHRLKLLMEKGAIDDYYSCVLPGRFNKKRHINNQDKFGVVLPANNCGCSCRKCAMHNLIMYYENIINYPSDFIDACWKVMWNNKYSADYKFFSPDLSLEERIKNLYTY